MGSPHHPARHVSSKRPQWQSRAECLPGIGIRPPDNHKRGKVGDFLREKFLHGVDLSFVPAYFTIYAYGALQAELDQVSSLRFLFGEPSGARTITSAPGNDERPLLAALLRRFASAGHFSHIL